MQRALIPWRRSTNVQQTNRKMEKSPCVSKDGGFPNATLAQIGHMAIPDFRRNHESATLVESIVSFADRDGKHGKCAYQDL
jgi:hypothetical protein